MKNHWSARGWTTGTFATFTAGKAWWTFNPRTRMDVFFIFPRKPTKPTGMKPLLMEIFLFSVESREAYRNPYSAQTQITFWKSPWTQKPEASIWRPRLGLLYTKGPDKSKCRFELTCHNFNLEIPKKGFVSRFVVFQGKRLKNHGARISLKGFLFKKRGIVAPEPLKPKKPLFCSFIKAARFQTFIESPQLRLGILLP